jgi:hypothetical protein
MARFSTIVFLLVATWQADASAQGAAAAEQVRVGIRVDTTTAPFHEIFSAWRDYLQSSPDGFKKSANWSKAEQDRWPFYNLTYPWSHQTGVPSVRAMVVAIDPVTPGHTDEFVVRTLFTTVDPATSALLPVSLTRVYAVREGGRWVLSNAFLRLTASWPTAKRGRITFVYSPTHQFDEARARESVKFVDSLAATFDVPPRPAITFVLADRPEELSRIFGVDFALSETNNGRSMPANDMILSGLPIYGEFYPHELTHLVLARLVYQLGASSFWDEALAMSIGGSRGKPFPELMRELDAALKADPTIQLETQLKPGGVQDSLTTRAAAALIQLTLRRAGTAGVKRLLTPIKTPAGSDHWLAAESVLGWQGAELERELRAFVRQEGR